MTFARRAVVHHLNILQSHRCVCGKRNQFTVLGKGIRLPFRLNRMIIVNVQIAFTQFTK